MATVRELRLIVDPWPSPTFTVSFSGRDLSSWLRYPVEPSARGRPFTNDKRPLTRFILGEPHLEVRFLLSHSLAHDSTTHVISMPGWSQQKVLYFATRQYAFIQILCVVMNAFESVLFLP